MSRPISILCGAALSLAFWPGLHSPSLAPKWAVLALAGPLLARRMPTGALILLAWPAITLTWSPAPLPGAGDLIHLGIILGAFLALRENAEDFLWGAVCGIALQAPLIAAQLLGFTGVEQLSTPPAGLFLNRDILGEAAAPLAVWLLLQRRALGLVLLGVVLASGSRIAIGLSGAALVLTPGLWPIGLLGIAAASGLLADPGRAQAALERISIWSTTALEAPFWGAGLGSFAARWPFWEYSHSDLLQAAYELGWIPAAAILAWAVGLARFAWRSPVGGAFLVFLCEAVFDFPLHTPLAAAIGTALAARLVLARSGIQPIHAGSGTDVLSARWSDSKHTSGRVDSPIDKVLVSAGRTD